MKRNLRSLTGKYVLCYKNPNSSETLRRFFQQPAAGPGVSSYRLRLPSHGSFHSKRTWQKLR